MKLHLKVWRQAGPDAPGAFSEYDVDDAYEAMTLLELLDRLNDRLIEAGEEPIAFESDCREGICGCCGMNVNGRPHGPKKNTPSCHQHLSSFKDGDTITLEPMRSAVYPVVKDLIIDRGKLDRVLEAGGWVSIDAGTAPDADSVNSTHEQAERSLDYAACIGCGACVAACPNGAAHLFTGAKLMHLGLQPLAAMERGRRAKNLVDILEQDFGSCSYYGECAEVCPANIPITAVAAVNKERLRRMFRGKDD